MNIELLPVKNKKDAERVIDFLYSPNAFHWDLSQGERDSIKARILLASKGLAITPAYWFYKNQKEEVVGTGGIEKLPDTNKGYFLGWFAIHKNYRKQGLGKKLVQRVEDYAFSLRGRFITIDTGKDNEANIFYQKLGYKKIAEIPEYFEDLVSKIIYYKKLQ
jgi:ribosomal protein S18 acetylase RimI-like enzyme